MSSSASRRACGAACCACAVSEVVTLYLQQPGTVLRRDGGALVVERADEAPLRVPLPQLGRVLLWGGTHITTPALRLLAEAGVEVALMSERGVLGWVQGSASAGLVRLLAQVRSFHDPALRLARAHELVEAKLAAQRALVRSAWWRGDESQRQAVLAGLICPVEAPDLDTLRGHEGRAARLYFSAFGELLRPPWTFSGRNRRPPRDPVNALLSLGYMLLAAEVRADVTARGLDARLGFLHAVRPGRPALALDLMEPWRPGAVDRWALTLLNRGRLQPSDFEPIGEGVRLSPRAFARAIDAWEAHLGSREPPAEGALPSLRRCIAAWIDGFEARLVAGASDVMPDMPDGAAADGQTADGQTADGQTASEARWRPSAVTFEDAE